ncbi:hypothetical protein [uncultured Maribacter sp.]|uniref:hypothetical protein n=1 Tax=uncultured Maribacter sp. TaxID=431308 RepID=UPI002636D0A8|nr:hypothetical protein [uncultured Maribacter sp.]
MSKADAFVQFFNHPIVIKGLQTPKNNIMITKKLYFLAACFCLVALNYSCTEESTAETDDTYGVARDEIEERDT